MAIFSFWSYEAEIWWKGVFLSSKVEFLLKTTDKRQFDVKNDNLGIFNGFHLRTLRTRGYHGNKEGSILTILISKFHQYMSR